MAARLDEVRALAERVAASHGLEVVDVEFAGGGGKHRTLRVFLEKNKAGRQRLREALERLGDGEGEEPEGEWAREWLEALPSVANLEHLSGITHEDCEVFSRDFGTVLDVEDLVAGAEYLLEVSSPGLDRRLASEGDFERFQGSLAKVETRRAVGEPGAERKKWQGRIAGVENGQLLLTPEEEGGGKKAAKGKKAPAREAARAAAEQRTALRIPLGEIEQARLVPEF